MRLTSWIVFADSYVGRSDGEHLLQTIGNTFKKKALRRCICARRSNVRFSRGLSWFDIACGYYLGRDGPIELSASVTSLRVLGE